MATPVWTPFAKNYEQDKEKIRVTKVSASTHPLLPRTVKPALSPKGSNNSTSNNAIVTSDPLNDPLMDPLGAFLANSSINSNNSASANVIDDPLSSLSNKQSATSIDNTNSNSNTITNTNSNSNTITNTSTTITNQNLWENRKLQILKEYAIDGDLTFDVSSIREFAGTGVEDGTAQRRLDKYHMRLTNLEKRNVEKKSVQISQKEYKELIEKLASDLRRAWANDERVGSIKIAIQLARLLADTNVPKYYPSMFVMITTVLDEFGDMVFNRLRLKANESLSNDSNKGSKNYLPDDFAASDVPQLAKETCRNWFYKIACIRELLPRIYIEITLLKCYKFLTDTDYPPILSRLTSICRGLGDPLMSIYARTYLLIKGTEVIPSYTNYYNNILQDIIFNLHMFKQDSYATELERLKINNSIYFYLLSPGLDWIISNVGKNATKEIFQTILQLYRENSNDTTILKHIIEYFDPVYYAHGTIGMITLIKNSTPSYYTHVDCYSALGKQLSSCPPPEDQRLAILNEVWKIVTKSNELLPFVRCTSAWIYFVQKYYTERELLIILSSLSNKLKDATSNNTELPDNVLAILEEIITSLIGESSTFGTAVLTSEHLLKILDVFKGIKKVQLCKDILETFKKQPSTNDPVLINTLFDLARAIHDSIDRLSPLEDLTYNSNLLCSFIDKIDYGRDFEQQLNFYVECRAVLCNFEQVKDKLIFCVSGLAMKTLKYVKGRHLKKTSTFVKACLAYCHITIPSLSSVFRKLQLLLYCAEVSLANQCLPQTDTFLKAAISLIPEMPTFYDEIDGKKHIHYEEKLSDYILSLLSFLVVAPGHPEHGPFYIIQGLLNAIPSFQWQIVTGIQIKIYINILNLLTTLAQRKFPYHIYGVESNNELYGGAEAYLTELNDFINICITEILKLLTQLGERQEVSSKLNQVKITIIFINEISNGLELTKTTAEFLFKLIELVYKNKNIFTRNDQKLFEYTIQFATQQAKLSSFDGANVFINALKKYTLQ